MRSAVFGHLKCEEATHVGLKRANNEDSVVCVPRHGVFCLADGMGGVAAGEYASKVTVDGVAQAAQAFAEGDAGDTLAARKKKLIEALNEASRVIFENAKRNHLGVSGSTASVLLFDPADESHAYGLHAGDSRIYRYRDGFLMRLTKDHSFAEEAGFADENDLPAQFRGLVTRAVGIDRKIEVEETVFDVKRDDVFLVCSDGLTRMVPDRRLSALFRDSLPQGLSKLVGELIREANDSGGIDNTTVILVHVQA